MSLYNEAKTIIIAESVLLEQFEVNFRMHGGSMWSIFLQLWLMLLLKCQFMVVMWVVVCWWVRQLSYIKLAKLKEAIMSKCLKVNLGRIKMVVSGGITKDGLFRSNVGPCGIWTLRVRTNSVLCVQCG